ncbi:hypothetical protein CBOM_00103 [Ceraceosorus bombacis]|uniref:Uncharacterized protein n=1 Tax=Ceraceosorus bombacis TaxID=401625 RepID=A0A0P1B8T2_9BASI|nr:hypothetical protein CBOM_00103 [Ceraceosorus bombacis]
MRSVIWVAAGTHSRASIGYEFSSQTTNGRSGYGAFAKSGVQSALLKQRDSCTHVHLFQTGNPSSADIISQRLRLAHVAFQRRATSSTGSV